MLYLRAACKRELCGRAVILRQNVHIVVSQHSMEKDLHHCTPFRRMENMLQMTPMYGTTSLYDQPAVPVATGLLQVSEVPPVASESCARGNAVLWAGPELGTWTMLCSRATQI